MGLPARRLGVRSVLLAVALTALLPAVGLTLFDALDRRAETGKAARNESLRLARGVAAQHAQVVGGARQLLSALVQLPEVRAAGSRCGPLLAGVLREHSQYANLAVADRRGDVVCSALPASSRVNVADRPAFRRAVATRAFAVGDYAVGPISGKAVVALAFPILAGGRLLGVAIASLDLDRLGDAFALGSDLPSGSALVVFDSRGTILAREPDAPRWVGRRLPAGVLRVMLARRQGTATAVGTDGVRRFFGFARLPAVPLTTPVYVSVGIPAGAALAGANRDLIRDLVALAIVAALALAAARTVALSLLARPLWALAAAARRVGAGDLAARAGTRAGPAELLELAGAFDELAESLQLHATADEELKESLARQVRERTALLSAVIEGTTDAVYVKDLEGRYLVVNPGAERVTGRTAAELLGRTDAELWPEAAVAFLADDLEVIRSGDAMTFEEVFNLAGATRSYQTVKAPYRDAAGRVIGVIGVARDVTERRKQAATLQRALAELGREAAVRRAVLDATPDAIRLVDLDGHTVFANAVMERFGREVVPVSGTRTIYEQIAELAPRMRDPAAYRAAVEAMAADPEREGFDEYEIVDRGTIVRRFTAPVRDVTGELIGRLILLRDVTAERQAERLKSELVATVSHELRTPLTGILGFSELLASRELDEPTRRRYTEKVRTEAVRLTALLDDFLDLQRLESGTLPLVREPVELCRLLRENVELYAAKSAAHALSLDLPGEELVVSGDRECIERVFESLLSNAMKYSPEGGPVRVEARARDGCVRVSVTDSGLGIPAAARERVFTRFFRADSSDTRRIGGTGLGLALCKGMVEANGGEIGFESVEGEGSTFWFELPAGEGAA